MDKQDHASAPIVHLVRNQDAKRTARAHAPLGRLHRAQPIVPPVIADPLAAVSPAAHLVLQAAAESRLQLLEQSHLPHNFSDRPLISCCSIMWLSRHVSTSGRHIRAMPQKNLLLQPSRMDAKCC